MINLVGQLTRDMSELDEVASLAEVFEPASAEGKRAEILVDAVQQLLRRLEAQRNLLPTLSADWRGPRDTRWH